MFVTRILRLTTYLGDAAVSKALGKLDSCTDCLRYLLHNIYSRIGANICTKYQISMLEEIFKDSYGTSLTAPDSF